MQKHALARALRHFVSVKDEPYFNISSTFLESTIVLPLYQGLGRKSFGSSIKVSFRELNIPNVPLFNGKICSYFYSAVVTCLLVSLHCCMRASPLS
jgi:hypothetical protein